jgi:lambda family phage portal protein
MWPFNRKKKSAKRGYAGAQYSRLVADWVTASTSIDSEIRKDLRKLRDRSRDLTRNNDYVRNFFRAVENNVIGQGIGFQAQVKQLRGNKLDEKINTLIEEKWQRWTRKEFCHVAGQLSFNDIERLCIREVGEAGDFYVRMIRQPFGGSKIPFALELIEADLVDHDMNGMAPNGNQIRMGVEVDSWGRPTAYYLFQHHPGDYQHVLGVTTVGKRVRVDAREMIPLFMPERAGQTRGVPWVAASIMRLHHMQGYQEAEVIAARAGSSLMGFIETDAGELEGEGVQDGQRVTEFEPGVFKQMRPGERVTVPDLHRPDGNFDPFMRAMLRGVAAGMGASYETLSRDYSQSNYSSSRLALIDDRDNWRAIQAWMIRNFHQIVFENWLDMAVLSGEINLPGYEVSPERYQAVKWMPRGWAWVDPAKEVSAYKEAVKAGFTTLTEVISQEGRDFEEVMQQRAREQATIESLDLVFDTNSEVIEAESGAAAAEAMDQGPASPEDTKDQ